MWLYVPSLSAPASADSNSDWLAGRSLWCTSSGKPSQRPSSWPGWKKRAWRVLLCGTTSQPSTAARFVAAWISSRRDSPARRSRSRASSSARTTSATSGRSFAAPLCELERRSFSWRTCGALFDMKMGSGNGSPTLPASGSMRSGRLFQRATLEPRKSASESSSWPTAASTDSESSARHSTTTGVMHAGTSLTDAVRKWPTATATPYGSSQNGVNGVNGPNRRPSAATPSLEGQARALWATPTSHERTHSPREVDHGEQLANQGARWNCPTAHDDRRPGLDMESKQGANLRRQVGDFPLDGLPSHARPTDSETTTSGDSGSSDPDGSRTSPQAVLNPFFVEALMGLPRGWTVPIVCAGAGTVLCPTPPARPSSSSAVERLDGDA